METEQELLLGLGADVTYLAACALHGKCPDRAYMARMDLAAVYRQAARHSMQAITYMALSSYLSEHGFDGLTLEQSLAEDWKRAHDRAVRTIVMFDLEREKITNFFEQKGIWYMPLKGLVLQYDYPRLGMRQMCDNDILFDPERRVELHDFMVQNGYEVKSYMTSEPDTYRRAPFYNFEMHCVLYYEFEQMQAFVDYYQTVKERLIPQGDGTQAHRFSDEDFYIYFTVHAYRHFVAGGNGLRYLMDIFAFMKNRHAMMDMTYVEGELERLGILEFEQETRALAMALYGEQCANLNTESELLTQEQQEFLTYLIRSGTYGIPEHRIKRMLGGMSGHRKQKIARGAKLKYCLRRIFPDATFYKINYPFLDRHKILIPPFLIYRMFKGLFHIGKFRREISAVRRAK